MSSIPASVQQPANTITAIKTFMVTFLQCSFSVSSSSRLMHSTGAAFKISIALTNIRSHAVPTVNLYLLLKYIAIVNLTEIASIKCDQLKLKNNEVLYVAKKYRQEIKSRHLQNLKMKKL